MVTSFLVLWSIIIIFFQRYFRFFIILHRVFTQNLQWRMVAIVYIQCFICSFLGCYFFIYIDRTLLRKWYDQQRENFYILYRLVQPGILLMCLSVPFWILSSGNFKESYFLISISKSLYLLILLYSLTDMLLSVGTGMRIEERRDKSWQNEHQF